MDDTDRDAPPPAREPLFNAPAPAIFIAAVIAGSYLWQVTLGGGDAAVPRLGFTTSDLVDGRWWTPLTVTLVHGGWIHAIMNAVWAFVFAPPVARLFGGRAGGWLAFIGLYAACAAFSSLAYAALHLNTPFVLIGASGAVSGLMGAASRLRQGGDRPAPILDREVLGMAAGWGLVNLLVGLVGLAPGVGVVSLAWQAHIAGYLAGMVLIGLVAPRPASDAAA